MTIFWSVQACAVLQSPHSKNPNLTVYLFDMERYRDTNKFIWGTYKIVQSSNVFVDFLVGFTCIFESNLHRYFSKIPLKMIKKLFKKANKKKCDEWEIYFLFLLCTGNLYLPHLCYSIFVIINKKYKCRLSFDKAKQIEWKYIYLEPLRKNRPLSYWIWIKKTSTNTILKILRSWTQA